MNWYEYEVREDKSGAESKQQQTTSNQPAADKQIYQRIQNSIATIKADVFVWIELETQKLTCTECD